MADEKNPPGSPSKEEKSNETDEATAPKISIIIKTAKDKESIEISQDASISEVSHRCCDSVIGTVIQSSVLWFSHRYCDSVIGTVIQILWIIKLIYSESQLREKVAEKFEADLECVCLIFAGKILKDFETLETHSEYFWYFWYFPSELETKFVSTRNQEWFDCSPGDQEQETKWRIINIDGWIWFK